MKKKIVSKKETRGRKPLPPDEKKVKMTVFVKGKDVDKFKTLVKRYF